MCETQSPKDTNFSFAVQRTEAKIPFSVSPDHIAIDHWYAALTPIPIVLGHRVLCEKSENIFTVSTVRSTSKSNIPKDYVLLAI